MSSAVPPASDSAARRRAGGEAGRRRTRPARRRRARAIPLALAVSLVALLGLYLLAVDYLQPGAPGRAMTLDEVIRAAAAHQIQEVTFLDEDARIVGTAVFRPGAPVEQFWTSYAKSDALTNELFKTFYGNNATVRFDQQEGKRLVRFVAQFLLPLMILADLFGLIFYFLQSRAGAANEFVLFGRIGDRLLRRRQRERTTFQDVAGNDEAIVELAEVRDYLATPGSFAAMGAMPPKGVLLVGPPGCGKTLLARAVAGEAAAAFFSVSGSEFVEALVGVGAARVRDLFRQARAAPPAIIFIDELDAVGRQRGTGLGQGHDEREQTLNEMLVQMDGFAASEGVVVMAATNRPDILDPALLRAGRFDRHVTVDRPDVRGRFAILQLHARGRRLSSPETDLPAIAASTPGFTGADLANLLNEAALLAVRERSVAIGRVHLEEAVDRVLAGPRRRGMLLSTDDKRRIAYHEAGHAIAAAALGKAALVQKVSIIARGRGVGHLAVLQEDKPVWTKRDMDARIAIAVAGILAEELVFGEPSTGSEQDIDRATITARDMAGRYGMSKHIGLVRVLREDREVFLGRDYLSTRDVSQPTLAQLDTEVRRILDDQEGVARSILGAHRPILDVMAAALVSHETLQGDDLARQLGLIQPYLSVSPQRGVT